MVDPTPSVERGRTKLRERMTNIFRGRPPAEFREETVDAGATMRSFSTARTRNLANGRVELFPTDEILQQKGWGEYRKMLHDPQIKFCLWMKKVMIYGRKWDVEPASDSEFDKSVCEFVRDALKRAELKEIMREAMDAFQFGFSVGELVWKREELNGKDSIVLDKVVYRDPEFMTAEVDRHGNIMQWKQDPMMLGGTNEPVTLAKNKVFHYANDQQFNNPYGHADMRAAYRAWWSKKFIVQFWNVFLERLGSPLMAAKYPEGATPVLKDNLKKILKGLSSKTEVLIPKGVEIELIEATRSGTASYDDALNYQDKEIARAILVVALLGAAGIDVKRGSDSQSRLHLRTMHKMADEIGGRLMREFHKQVIVQLVDFNFDVDAYPTVFWQDYGEFEAFEITDAIRLLHAAGILELDQQDVNFARSILNLPIRTKDDEDEVIRPQGLPPPADANQPPPAAEQGNERAEQGASQTEDDQ